MSGGIEGVGDAVTGGIVARAVEPGAGETVDRAEGDCLNCGTALVGAYCHSCGQPGHIHRTVSAWWHDLAHGVLHFEGKIWRTLPMLAWHPGQLTRRYIHGERARFVSPLALFLFSVFLMFALFSALHVSPLGIHEDDLTSGIEREIRDTDRRVATLEAQRGRAAAARQDTAAIDEDLAEARRERAALARSSAAVAAGEPRNIEINSGWKRLDEGVKKASENPQLLFYKLQTNAYKYGWALIPISLPFLWLLFLHRRRYREEYKAYDHLVFVTYSISFMSLALIAAVALSSIGISGGPLAIVVLIVPPVHIYRQLRGAYLLSRFSAAWRTAVLLVFASIAMGFFGLLLLALGVLA
jgi:hypothetical protein